MGTRRVWASNFSGGCIAGAGTVRPPEKSRAWLEKYKSVAPLSNPLETAYIKDLSLLHEGSEAWERVSHHGYAQTKRDGKRRLSLSKNYQNPRICDIIITDGGLLH